MTPGSATPPAFAARADDDDDVRWALSTALVQWNRGGKADAVVWLRRAGEAADVSGAPARAEELRSYAAMLAQRLWEGPGQEQDTEVDVKAGSADRRAPPPPPPHAVQAAQRAGSVPPNRFQPEERGRQSLLELEPEREHFPSAPEIVLEEEALDPTELEEILDYVGEDDVEFLEEVPESAKSARQAGVGGDFSDRLSSADVESLSVEAMLPTSGGFDSDASELARDSDPEIDRLSETEAFELRPSQRAPESRHPAVALPLGGAEEEFDDRATLVPIGEEGESGSDFEFAHSLRPGSAPDVTALGAGTLSRSGPPDSIELLVGESAAAIDADLATGYHPESIDLGADWAPIESERAPERTSVVNVEEELLSDPAPEADAADDVEPTSATQLVPFDSVPPSASLDSMPESLPPLEFPSDAPPEPSPSIAPLSVELEFEDVEDRETEPLSVSESERVQESEVPASLPPVLSAAHPPIASQRAVEQEEASATVVAAGARDGAEDAPDDELVEDEARGDVPFGAPELEVGSDAPPLSEPPISADWMGGSTIDGVDLATTRGFEDLPEEVQELLAKTARVEHLAAEEEAGLFGAAVITHGQVRVMPDLADEAGAIATQGDVVFTRGTLKETIALRVVATLDDTRVAVWDPEPLNKAIEDCPWVHDELRMIADRFLALCGAALGPLGERLDETLRTTVFARLEVKTFSQGESLTTEGQPLPGLFVVGGGRVELFKGDQVVEVKNPGEFLFAQEIMGGAKAPATAKAGAVGALVLFAPRSVAHELMISVPPLLEVLAG